MSDNHWRGPSRQEGRNVEDEPDDDAIFDLERDPVALQDPGRPGFWERRRSRHVRGRTAARAAVREYIEQGMPPDSDAGFDPDTFSGRAGGRIASSHWWKVATALLLLITIAGWFTLLCTRPSLIISALAVPGLVLIPVLVLWLLGRHSGGEPDA